MNWLPVLAVGLLVLLYLRSPIDLIPDRIGLRGLLDDLIVLICAVLWLRRRLRRPAHRSRFADEPADTGAAVDWDPYAVLGVRRGASVEEIAHAYREQMKRYHPDRVDDLGEELRGLAHRKALEIQRAYEEIGKA